MTGIELISSIAGNLATDALKAVVRATVGFFSNELKGDLKSAAVDAIMDAARDEWGRSDSASWTTADSGDSARQILSLLQSKKKAQEILCQDKIEGLSNEILVALLNGDVDDTRKYLVLLLKPYTSGKTVDVQEYFNQQFPQVVVDAFNRILIGKKYEGVFKEFVRYFLLSLLRYLKEQKQLTATQQQHDVCERLAHIERLVDELQQRQIPIIIERLLHISRLQQPPTRTDIITAFKQCGAELSSWPNRIAGIHIDRTEVDGIASWVLNAEPSMHLGVLVDQPGAGKTVVMRDLLERLEAQGVPVLVIKADALSNLVNSDDLAKRLQIPMSVEDCVVLLATQGKCVILIDQLDALSLSISRDQATLDLMLSTLARLRTLERVRVVASCRKFDLENDPRLATIEADLKFELKPLDNTQVERVLDALAVDPACLLPAHRDLLSVPLHLNIYAQLVAESRPDLPTEEFHTLQELYEALWRKLVQAVSPDSPTPRERTDAIYVLVDWMQERMKLHAPVAILDHHIEAARYLESVGFIRQERHNWLFLHQTLFDYCYARRFVSLGRSLCDEILASDQGLFQRSQMVQVLAYLRGSDAESYCNELKRLIFTQDLRVHLRLLLLSWFGSLPKPTTDEVTVAKRLMQTSEGRADFLQASHGNLDWFDVLSGDVP